MRQRLFVIALSILIYGCTEDTNQQSEKVTTIEVHRILLKNATITGRTITLTVDCEVPDPCWEYSHFNAIRNEYVINLKVYAKQKPVDGCAAVLWSFDTKLNIQVPTAGSYTLHYKSDYSSYTDSTFVIN